MANSNLVVPVMLWGRHPPTHCISAVMITSDQRTIVTGCHDGQIVLWDFSENLRISARNMLYGHTSAITCLSRANDSWDKSNIISAAENGELCLWDTDDGRCIEHTKVPGTHTNIHPIQVTKGTGRESWVILHGFYSDIHILDSNSLEILFTLTCKVTPDWISALTLLRPVKRQEDVIIALTTSGTLKVWTLTGAESKDSEPVFEDESKPLRCLNAQSLTCCAFTLRTVLVVCSKYWQIYDAGDFSLLCSVFCEKGQKWAGGDFIAADRVVVWTKEGKGYLYQLPSNCIPDNLDFRSGIGKKPGNNVPPFLYCVLEVSDNKNRYPLSCSPAMSFFYGRRGPYLKLLLRGDSNGRVTVWKMPEISEKELGFLKQEQFDTYPVMPPTVSSSLKDLWNSLDPKPPGIIDQLSLKSPKNPDDLLAVTSSIYLPSQGRLVCGRDDGSIVIVPATQTAIVQFLQGQHTARRGWPPHRILRGHRGKVTCLLYPHQIHERYDPQYLVSGGVDFCNRLWDIYSGTLLFTFSVHGGEVSRMLVPPENCNTRVQGCICSVASDHSVALLSLRDRKCMMLAGRHLFPVRVIKWRPADDFLLIGCTDDTVYVWQMETGHLDRIVYGSTALEIMNACDETVKADEAMLSPAQSIAQALRRRSLTPLKNAAQRSIIAAANQALGANTTSGDGQKTASNSLMIQPIRANVKDYDSHVLFFDTEALIVQLLTDDNLIPGIITPESTANLTDSQKTAEKQKSSPKLAEKVAGFIKKEIQKQMGDDSDSDSDVESQEPKRKSALAVKEDPEYHNRKSKNLTLLESNLTLDISQLFMSCLHAWGLDPSLDQICLTKLGLLKPHSAVCFGLFSRGGHMSLMMPGWHKFPKDAQTQAAPTEQASSTALSAKEALEQKKSAKESLEQKISAKPGIMEKTNRASHLSHWELSRAVTTQHLLSVISVANTLMSMNNASFVIHSSISKTKKSRKRTYSHGIAITADSDSDISTEGDNLADLTPQQAQIKQGWSLLAALHCVLLPDLLGSTYYKPPQLEMLARRWQDRCLEVREAAQALLLAELRRIGSEGRQEVLNSWAPYLPNYVDPQMSLMSHVQSTEGEKLTRGAESQPEASGGEETTDAENEEEILSGLYAGQIIGDILPTTGGSPARKVSTSFESRRKQATAIVMLGVVGAEFGAEMTPSKGHGSKRNVQEAGFGLKDYSLARHTAKALTFLLLQPPSVKLPAHTPIRRAAIDLIGRGFTVWEPYMDVSAMLLGMLELCCDSEKHATAIKSGLPLSPAADSCRTAHHALSLIATARPSVFITTMAREVARHQALAANTQYPASILNSSPLVKAKPEILRIIELLIDKMQNEVAELLVEVMDIVVHCLDPAQLKARGLSEVFPAITRFSMVSYCANSRRVAVGARSGALAMYDQRTAKCQMISGHQNAVTAVSFSADGKYLATYSYGDHKLCFWQTGSTLFGAIGLGSGTKCVKCYNTVKFQASNQHTLLKMVKLYWLNNKTAALNLSSGTEYRFTV
ncbi:WD repeat-containing protein 7-like [Ptychodera flava]|uniref:WD repeat-containing protein 7-like n=1 Tax=Ptychodera flava TaxID=63121 RepID=UPI003969F91E